jgi:2-keto-3-deoxy-L-rhamnonate aldolase RhmA
VSAMQDNPVKTKLLAGGHAFGLFAMEFFTPGFPQIVKAAGAEFILFDMEHSAAGIDVMKNQIALCRGVGITPFVRVPQAQYHFIARLLDAGAMGIMVPMVETVEQADLIVRSAHYPPAGRRGAAFGIAQDDYVGGSVPEKIASAHERTLLMLQIETERGLENLDAIAAVPGFDSLWIGFLDLSNFLGVHGDYGHPEYLEAIDRIVAAGRKHAKVLGTAAPSEAFAKDYYAKGFRMIAHASDFGLMQSALSQRLQALSRFAQSGS